MSQAFTRAIAIATVGSIVAVPLVGFAPAVNAATWKDLAAILQDSSGVADLAGHPAEGQFLSTLMRPVPGDDRMILVYQRVFYDGARKPRSRQVINYTFQWTDLNASTINLIPWQGQYADEEFFLVSIEVNPKPEFILYSNLMEERLQEGGVDITGSRGRIRKLVLGYFIGRETAERFTQSLRDFLHDPA